MRTGPISAVLVTLLTMFGSRAVALTWAGTPTSSTLASSLKKEVLRRVTEEREVMTHAELHDAADMKNPELKQYDYYAVMSVNASPEQTRRILTRYDLYEKMISYVSRSKYEPGDQTLQIEGGIWGFRMASRLKIEERGPHGFSYRIIGGHFTGMTGAVLLEPLGERSTLVLLKGQANGRNWPPRLILERGAEIVFGYTGRRMRSYIESEKDQLSAGGRPNDPQLPQPRKTRFTHH